MQNQHAAEGKQQPAYPFGGVDDSIDRRGVSGDSTGVWALTLISGWSDFSAMSLANCSFNSTDSMARN